MTFKKTEKEIIKAIVKYDGKAKSLAEVFNKSQLLEKKGIGIVQYGGKNMVFLRKDLYDDWFHNDGLGYIAELLSLIDTLIKQKYLVMIPFCTEETLVIGAQESRWLKPEVILVNGNEYICVADRMENWFSATREQKYWPCAYSERELPIGNTFNMAFSVSQELRELVKHNFKSEEEVRFIKQQRLTWISIAVAAAIGLLGIIF
jgi:hypothetical protein